MSELDIIPFEPVHLEAMRMRGSDPEDRERSMKDWKDRGGVGYTALYDQKVVMSGTVTRLSFDPDAGVAEIFTGERADKHRKSVVQTVREKIPAMAKQLGIKRLYAAVEYRWLHWISVMGFEVLGTFVHNDRKFFYCRRTF